MATLSLKISIEGGKVVKTIQFEPSTTVYDACRIIREKILEASAGDPKEYGLFLASEEDNKKGIWLEASRSLDYYMLRNGDLLEYNKKTRNLRVRMLDGTVKTLLVDDSQIVANLMVVICTKIGITNYDEYGLVREEQKDECDPCEKPNYGTLTLKRRHQEKERDAKMEQLRKKLRTDDEVNWVEPSKTLREQGVEATETLLLRRKLFFSDRNVDSRDPVQLTLLYVQARDAIVDGTHPVTQDKACEFAGIQCQIQFGDHREDKHMPGFLDLKEFLPASYVKVKNIEKKVLKEHRRHATLSELDAKVLYTKSARELPTYGVAFFLVKEKMKGKNKLVPRLLGVTKDSVLRLDEKTKEILQSWPLTTVRRWCASPNTFTLDFGDYSDQYYSVQTTEAEQILQVIAGYIDIIVRKQRAKEHLGIDGDEGSAMLEDSVSPSKANIIQHDTFKSGKVNTESVAKPAVHRPGAEGAKPFAVGHITGAQQTTVSGQIITGHTPPAAGQSQHTQVTSLSTEPQRALLSTISTGTQLIKKAQEELVMAELPELGSDAASIKWKQVTLDSNKQVVTSQIAAMNAATAQVVTLTSGPQEAVDHTAVGAAITSITTNLPHVTRGVGLLAALLPANGDSLLSATKRLCTAFTDLLKAAEPDTDEPRQSLLNAASRVGEASTTVLHTIEDNEEDRETQDILLSLAKSVANTTAALVLKAKNVAAQCKNDQQLQNNIIAAATNCALATSQLVACAKVVAPTLQNPACREQLECAARQVAAGVRRLVDASAAAPDAPAHSGLAAAATRVSEELQRLLDHAQQARAPPTGVDVETVLTRSERVVLAPSPHEMVRHARLLGQATAVLITDIKTEAERQPSENQRKLLAAAKLLADATARMVEAARQCASEPQDPEKQAALRAAAEELRYIAADYATGTERVHDHVYKLQETALQAASSATQLITSAQNAAQYNTNKHAQESFSEECRSLHSVIPPMVEAAHAWTQHGGAAKQLDLVSASEAFLQRSGDIMMSARSCVPTVQDASAARHLADTSQQYADRCSSLRTSVSRVRSSSQGLELDAAAEILRSLEEDFRELEEAARACQLRPLPGQTEEWSMSAMSSSSRGLCSSAAQLVSAARGGAGQGRAAGELARHAREFTGAVRAAAASRPEGQDRVVSHGRHVVQSSLTLVETVQRYITSSEPLHAASLVQIANDISKGLESTMEAMPSQSELDEVLENINETLNILNMGDLPPSDRTYGALQSSLSSAAAELSACACALPEAVESRPALSAAAARYGDSFNNTMQAAMEMAHHTQDREAQTVMVSSMKSVTINSSKLLSTAKSISQDLGRPNGKNQLTAAVRAVTESINKLVDVCTEAGPGVKQCAAALRSVASAAPLLRPAADPLSDLTYYECLDHVVDHSKALSEGMSGMANAIKRSEQEQFGSSVTAVAAAVTGLVEVTAQAAYLVGASHPASSAGRAGLVDQAQFARAAAAIRAACNTLADPHTDQHQVLSAATAVARHTSALCNACRAASARSAEPQDKRTFVTAAKDVANCTATLVKEIKALDKDYTEANRQRCAAATGPLQDAVRSLCQFADSPDFASVPAKISPEGRQQQEVILDCGRNILSGSVSMLEAARALGAAPGERAQWQALATHSKLVSDTIKALVTNIREQAPGQRECAAACDTLSQQIRVLDRAELQAVSQQAAPPPNNTLEGYCSQVESCATEMLERVEPLRAAAAGHAEHLGHAVTQLVSYAGPLVEAGVGCSRRLASSAAPGSVLAHTRTVLEASGSLVQAAAASAGNPRATSAHATVESTATTVRAGLSELREAARALAARAGAVGPLLDTLTRATNTLTEHRMSLVGSYDENDSFVDYQTRMVGTAKDIARLATDMTAKSATDPSKLLDVANELCQNYESLAHDSVGAVATTPQSDTAARIRNCVVDVGEAVKTLVRAGADCRLAPAPHNQSEVGKAAKIVGEKVVSVLSALQSCSQGTQACIDAAANIANIISDLDTTILFASAGTLQSEVECEQFSDHRELILKTAKRLVEDTKALVGGAAGQQDQLAAAATAANDTITSLVQVVKGGALALGAHSPESQVVVLHAARDVAAALRDLAAATTAASGRHHHHPHMQRLKHAAKRSDPKRWSLPVKHNARQTVSRRLSINVKNDTSCDSETDMFQSDQEEELIKLLDYSSQDDDVSPSIFHDNCEDIISYIESLMTIPVKTVKNDDLNERYNLAARNSLVDMDWRVLKYGENIFLGEVKKLVDFTVDVFERVNKRNRIEVIKRLKAANVLDNEMKRLSQVIEDIDLYETNEVIITTETVVKNVVLNENNVKHENNAKIEVNGNGKRKIEDEKQTEEAIDLNDRIKSPIFRIKKVKPITLEPNFESVSPDVIKSPTSVNGDTDSPNTIQRKVKMEFWKMFQDDSEWWKALAQRNLDKMEETRRELERFSGHELVLGEIQSDLNKYDKEKETLEMFIEEVDRSKETNTNVEYSKKYEGMILKLIDFAKKDFIYKGFDPLIEQLKYLSTLQFEGPKRINVDEIIKMYTQIDISKYTYEELCVLENYYQEIIKNYKKINDKENTEPVFNKNVILNINTVTNTNKNINQYSNTTTHNQKRNTTTKNNRNNLEIFDLTRTYPMEYYANNWWTIYEDILKNREQQFGSIDQWWSFYESILNNKDTTKADLERIKTIMALRSKRRPNSRMEEQLKMLDGVKNDRFQETEHKTRDENESVMVTNVTSLLKTVKAVEDEHTRGLRALESTIEAISQEIEALSSPAAAAPCSPEELVRRTRHMTAATAGAVAAAHSHSQDTLTAAANQGRRTVLDLLHAVKGAAQECECAELRARTLAAGVAAGESFRAVLLAVLAAVSDPAQRQLLPERSRAVAATVADIIALAEQLKGSDWVDPSDPTVIAEHELLGAAASIDAAAKKLESLRPRKPIQETDENMNFDEMILEAAKSIIAATSALVRAASAAQRELIDQGKVARRPAMSSDDGQWSEGLVSAARLVAAAAHALVEAANALVCGHASEERLVSAARHVAATTAHLLVACKVKADPSSESTRRLQAAGGAVLRSTDGLVRAARDAITDHEERSLVLNRRMVGGIAQEIDARTEVLRIEKELEEARGRLTAIRQAKYKLKTADGGEDTDTDGADYARLKSPTSFINTTYSPNSTYSPHITQNTTNLSSHISQLNQTVGSPYSPTNQNAQTPTNHSASYANQTGLTNQGSNLSTNQMYDRNGSYSQNSMRDEKQYTVQSGSFSSFRPQDETPKQNYEGFTSRETTNDRTMNKNNDNIYETRLYDTPRPVNEYSKTERHDNQYYSKQEQMFNYEAPKSPLSPKFNARELKFDEPIYSSLKKPLDGLGQTFSEHQKSTEAIPGGTKHSEYSIKSESYQSFPKTEYSKIETREEVKSPFTSTPKIDRTEIKNSSTELVKAVTPDYDRIASPYGKEVHSYGGPNFMEETTTEVKEIPNGTQKITTTKIYSSSPVNITSTNTKYEPIKLEGIDELSKAFDNDSKYSTLDSRFNTLESKLSSDTSRSFMRPSDFQSSDYQTTTSVTKVKKPAELSKELDTLDKKFSKQTVTSETIERKSVMTSSHKSETSSTVTKKFGNF